MGWEAVKEWKLAAMDLWRDMEVGADEALVWERNSPATGYSTVYTQRGGWSCANYAAHADGQYTVVKLHWFLPADFPEEKMKACSHVSFAGRRYSITDLTYPAGRSAQYRAKLDPIERVKDGD